MPAENPTPPKLSRQQTRESPPEAGAHIAGVDIGGTKMEFAIVDAELKILASVKAPTPQVGGPAAVVAAILALLDQARESSKLGPVSAIGVGMPGSVTPDGSVSRSPNLPVWTTTYPLAKVLRERLGVPATVDNDVRSALRGEFRAGAARPFRDVLGVWFGTGVGGGLILDGEFRAGHRGAAGEIGHAVFKPDGRTCGCGRRGCLEAYAGRGSMEIRARERVDRGDKSELFALMKRSGRVRLTSSVIARALDHGDKLAHQLINDAVRAAGPVIASVVNVVDLEAVVIGGGLGARLGQPFARRIETAMQPHLFKDGPGVVKVVVSELGDQAGAVGAASSASDAARAAKGDAKNDAARDAKSDAEPKAPAR